MEINKKKIGIGYPTYFIADIGANHDGDLNRAKDLIYKAAESGADAAKFQHFKAKTIVSDFGFKNLNSASSHQKNWKKSVFEVYKDASINNSWTSELKLTCDQAGITFFTSPYDLSIVDEIDKFVPAYKIGSGDITWIKIIKYIASKNKPYIIATGASTLKEVKLAVNAGLKINSNLSIMQCNTNYTGSENNFKFINLNVLKTYAQMFPGLVLGLSDHTPGHSTVLGAISLGARIIEKHFTDDNSREGPDHSFAMNPYSWNEMINRSRELENALGEKTKCIEDNEKDTVVLQRRSIRVKEDMKVDTIINSDDLIELRPCPNDAIPPYEIDNILGKKLKFSKNKGDYLRWIDLL